jgi:predicted translin family RNA/ssDNA-binding protein
MTKLKQFLKINEDNQEEIRRGVRDKIKACEVSIYKLEQNEWKRPKSENSDHLKTDNLEKMLQEHKQFTSKALAELQQEIKVLQSKGLLKL